ncbi:methyltransferase domain-containing protein [Streptomyces sp. SID13031]|uniref:class I SAM-dependent methyltransferase n=1 Tax=Streptomyces sp. SID13031 TaxID=2706046 RepID=UPI0013CD330E|nr:methyltransferase domain-containing protein [Streptomyces sp. SID13031]NEA31174.1 methyltransferase domain-containing protein [Streptomyces sp. SID13031]
MTTSFDPIVFKQTTRAQWEEAAQAWSHWGPTIDDWLGEATDAMLRAAGIGKDDRVLDIAAGAGGQTLAAARLAGPGGSVLATDISPAILRYAARAATEAGIETVETLEADGENLSALAGREYDAAISRVGLIYFPDQQAALTGIRRALRPGGKFSAIVYSTPDRNGFFSIPVGIIRRRAELPPPVPDQPGPFSLGGPGVAEKAFSAAGFRDITVTTVPSPVRLPSAAECVRFERESFGALHQMLSRLDDDAKAAAWQEVTEQLAQFDGPQGFAGPCEILVVTGTR